VSDDQAAAEPVGAAEESDAVQVEHAPQPPGASAVGAGPARHVVARRALLASRVTLLCVIGAIAVIAAAGVTWVLSPGWGGGGGGGTTYAQPDVGDIPTAQPSLGLAALAISPNRIEIPRLRAIAPIVTVQTGPNRELGVPLDPKVVGWWNGGSMPGAKTGTAILDGHINYAGVTGVLANIGTLNPGDTVYVYGLHNGTTTRVRFSITGVRTYRKTALPWAEIFDQKSVGRLAIVTCGGPFDASTGNYEDNIVAFAVRS
jgi:Sortase domain